MTHDFARQLTEISRELHRQIGVLVTRKGEVEWVIVGSARQIVLPDLKRLRVAERRFRGLRCLHTHLASEPLTRDDLTDLALLRLDAMSAIEVREDGLPGVVRTAHLTPATADNENGDNAEPWELLPPMLPSQIDLDFVEFITHLEDEFAAKRGEHHRFDRRERAILVGVTTGSVEESRERLAELAELARFSEVVVLNTVVQKRAKLDPRYLIGKGKIEELVIHTLQEGADLIIFDRNLTPAQVRSISAACDLKILDRTQLILDIFARRAQSREGKIQVELAQLRYMLPRLTEMDTALSRLTGGIGGRGPGETKLEIDRRRARDRITRLQKEVASIRRKRGERRKRRVSRGLPIVTLVGYTNAGKSSLLNRLTKSTVAAGSRMFETLDPTSRRLRVPVEREVLLADTVGFIRDLPPELIEAFRATLEEIETSMLILHVVDASQAESRDRMDSVARILAELELDDISQITVFNKSDLLAERQRAELAERPDSLVVSALTGAGTEALVDQIGRLLKKQSHPSRNGQTLLSTKV
ncbi:MAG: GTPase HflX [Acidobacteriota bacterium]|nr:MAG: GTPase HflX [Acidobacteriota bacterium]